MKNTVRLASLVLISLAGLGCGEHDLLTASSFVALSLTPDSTTLSAIGEAPRLKLSARDLGGNLVEPRLVLWSSQDPATVEVQQDGTITALRDGTATITAYVGSSATTTTVTVDATVQMKVAITAISTRPIPPMEDSVAVVVYDKNAPISLRKP